MGDQAIFGWLRPEVQIFSSDTADSIRFAHWEVRLPKGTIAFHELRSVLTQNAPINSYHDSPELLGLLSLLDAQGCFRRVQAPEACSMRDFRRRFDRLRSAWYATYYAHPLWDRLRTGKASRNELLAWVVHNYHISRVAGATAARCASRPYARDIREHFVQDTFEEYWHVNAYYFVKHAGLTVRDEDIKCYVPLAGSRAFELHAMQVADRNLLGHLLIAYFQESTAVFLDDCISFYRDVERSYGIPGFFDTWIAHMRLDIDHGHANGLSRLFESDSIVAAEEQLVALRSAYFAFRYLLASLDQVLEQVRDDELLDIRSPHDFIARKRPTVSPSHTDHLASVAAELSSVAFRATLACLGRTLAHDELMVLGRLCRMLHSGHRDMWLECSELIWSEAIENLLNEQATNLATLAVLLQALELRCLEHGFSFLPSDALDTLEQIPDHRGDTSEGSLALAISVRRACEFLDLALQSAPIDTWAYTP